MRDQRPTFTDWVRTQTVGFFDPAGRWLHRRGVTANAITLLGLGGHVLAAILAAQGAITWAGVVLVVMAPLDALDGATARAAGQTSRWGAFLDSTVDRFAEAVLFLGLLVYYLGSETRALNAALVFVAFVGSIMVSYTRARAEGLGLKASVGLLSRLERYLILVPAMLIGHPAWGLWPIAILANLTALQRMWHVRQQALAGATPTPIRNDNLPPQID